MGRSNNATNGPEAMDAMRKTKKATSNNARGTRQKRGAMTKHKVGKSKFQKRDSSGIESLDEMEF